MAVIGTESSLRTKSKEFIYKHPNLVKIGAGVLALAVILPAAGCSPDKDDNSANPNTTVVVD